jgi:hypothetical protein
MEKIFYAIATINAAIGVFGIVWAFHEMGKGDKGPTVPATPHSAEVPPAGSSAKEESDDQAARRLVGV